MSVFDDFGLKSPNNSSKVRLTFDRFGNLGSLKVRVGILSHHIIFPLLTGFLFDLPWGNQVLISLVLVGAVFIVGDFSEALLALWHALTISALGFISLNFVFRISFNNLFPVFQACEKLGMAVFVHPWEMMGQEKMQKYWLPWLVGMPAETSLAICSMIFGGLFERLPKLRVAFAHGGGSFPSTIGRIEHGFNCRPDIVAVDNAINPRDYLGKFWLDSLVHDKSVLDYIIKLMGANRIALGSDYPFPLGETEPGKLIKEMPYNLKIKEKLLSGSALEWLNLKKNAYV